MKTEQEVEVDLKRAIAKDEDISDESRWITICYVLCVPAMLLVAWALWNTYH